VFSVNSQIPLEYGVLELKGVDALAGEFFEFG